MSANTKIKGNSVSTDLIHAHKNIWLETSGFWFYIGERRNTLTCTNVSPMWAICEILSLLRCESSLSIQGGISFSIKASETPGPVFIVYQVRGVNKLSTVTAVWTYTDLD